MHRTVNELDNINYINKQMAEKCEDLYLHLQELCRLV